MTSPKLAYNKPKSGRHYTHPQRDDVDYPSVTNILDVLSKPLTGWAARETAGAAWDNRHALVEIEDRQTAVDMLKGAPFKKRDQRADLGDIVHSVAEALAGDTELPDYPPEAEDYVDSFLQWVSDFGVTFLYTEFTVFSHAYGYAGTADALTDIAGMKVLCDWKTSGSGIYKESALQLAALAKAEEMALPNGDVIAMPSVDSAVALHLTPDGAKHHPIKDLEEAFGGFLGARQLWQWVNDHGDRTIGRPVDAQTFVDPFHGLVGEAG